MTTRHSRGFSIVELMVAIALGGILLAGAMSLFVNNRDTARITNEFSQMQDSARFAMDMMLRDLRMAGYFGCRSDGENVVNQLAVSGGDLWDVASGGIEGFENGSVDEEWYPSGLDTNFFGGGANVVGTNGDAGEILDGTDAFTVRYFQGTYVDADADDTPDMQVTSSFGSGTTTVAANNLDPANFPVGIIAGVSECGGADLFAVNTSAADTLTTAGALSREYANRAVVAPFVGRRYYIGQNSRGNPALYRADIRIDGIGAYTELPQELFEGVENMQVLYGLDSDDPAIDFDAILDGVPDVYVRADDANLVFGQVVSVKLALMVRSNTVHQGADLSGQAYQLLDVNLAPGDQFRRRVFTSTAVVRNQQ